MRDKFFIMLAGFVLLASLLSLVSAAASSQCNLGVTLVNQDPDPVLPGEYVKVVFQMSGTDNPLCKSINFKLVLSYPFSLDASDSATASLAGGTFTSDYQTIWNIPYRLRVAPDALDGDNKITVQYSSSSSAAVYTKEFNISVQDLRTTFEVSVKNYDSVTNTITFEILNTGEHDIEALTIDLPEQENVDLMGSPRNIVGSLDSNEETTFDFVATPKKGDIVLNILYTDTINKRRSLSETVYFNPDYYQSQPSGGPSAWFYLFVILVIIVVGRWFWKKRKAKKSK